jgi:predicted lactoylglutathione lyase
MPKMIFVNLPVRDLPAATKFYLDRRHAESAILE